MTSNYFQALENYGQNAFSTDAYARFSDENLLLVSGEGRMMFVGESPSFFTKAELYETLRSDDSALEAASESKDETIRTMALEMHLERVKES